MLLPFLLVVTTAALGAASEVSAPNLPQAPSLATVTATAQQLPPVVAASSAPAAPTLPAEINPAAQTDQKAAISLVVNSSSALGGSPAVLLSAAPAVAPDALKEGMNKISSAIAPYLKAASAPKIFSLMAIYHTDMMASAYAMCFFLLGNKLAVDGGGFVKTKVSPWLSWWEYQLNVKPPSLERKAHPHRLFHKSLKGADQSNLQTDTVENSVSFLERKGGNPPATKLVGGHNMKSMGKMLHIQAIYFDVLANFHIVMASAYSLPGALLGLKKPTLLGLAKYTRVLAFWYWGGVQYYVDLLDIYALSGAMIDTRQYDAWALRCKDVAFTYWMWENYLTFLQIGLPTAKNALSFLLTMDNAHLVLLAKICIYIAYMAEGGIKASGELAKMVPAYGMQFAYTAFHSDMIARMIL